MTEHRVDLLAGVSVLSLAINLPGPLTAARLTTMGASVTTVIPPSGDPLRVYNKEWFDDLHVGQQVLTLDLKVPEGAATLRELLKAADIVITSSRPSALARLGLDPRTLANLFPRLCQIAIVGESGEKSENPGHDLTYQAINGLIDPPHMPTTLIADMAGAERATQVALAALIYRDRTGHGSHHEIALADVARDMAQPRTRGLTAPGGGLGGGIGLYGIYETRSDWVALAAIEPHFAQRVLTELDVDGSPASIAAVMKTKTADQWQEWAQHLDIPLVLVHTPPH